MRVATTPVEDYELVGFLVMTSATVGEAFARGARFQSLWTSHGRWEPAKLGEVLGLTWSSVPDGRLGARVATESAVASMLVGIRALSRTSPAVREVSFAHPAPSDTSAHRALFGVEPRFGAASNLLELARETFDLPIPSGNVPLAAYLEEQCQALLATIGQATSVSDQLRRLFVESVQGPLPSLDRTARRLGMSGRTLARRLDEEGTSFQGVLDEVRRDLATRYLSQGRLSVSEVAYLTGFRSVSAFHRAHRRWTGQAPGRRRNAD
jgi:AraC-like DNA-binding protein